MSTIAYRDGIMAADSRLSGDGVAWGEVIKIGIAEFYGIPGFGNGSGLGGASGRLATTRELLAWLDNPAPPAPSSDDKEAEGIIVSPNGTIWLWAGTPRLTRIDTPYMAVGSGAKIALGAMAMGASAERAVEIAAQYDVYTGGRITTLSLREDDGAPEEGRGR